MGDYKNFGLIIGYMLFVVFSGLYIKSEVKPFSLDQLITGNKELNRQYADYQKTYSAGKASYLAVEWQEGLAVNELFSFLHQLESYFKSEFKFSKIQSLASVYHITAIENNFQFVDSKNLYESFPKRFIGDELVKTFYPQKNIALVSFEAPKGFQFDRLENFFKEQLKNINGHLIGYDYFQYFLRQETKTDQLRLVPFMIMFIFLSFWFLFSSLGASLIAMVTMLTNYVLCLCFIVFWEGSVSPFGQLALLISLVMTVSDIIHIFCAWGNKPIPVRQCLYTSLTTAVGLGSLFFSSNQGLNNFALYGLFSVFTSYIVTFIFVPFLIKSFSVKVKVVDFFPPITKISQGILKYKVPIIVIFLGLLIGVSSQVRNIIINEDDTNQFSSSTSLSQSYSFFKENMAYAGQLDLILRWPRNKILSLPGFQVQEKIMEELNQIPTISKINSVYNIKSQLSEIGQLNAKGIQGVSQFGLFKGWVPWLKDESRWNLVLNRYDSISVFSTMKDIKEKLGETIKDNKIKIEFNGYGVVRAELMRDFASTFFKSIGFSLLGIFSCFLLLFRSFKLSLLGMIPNVAPVLLVWGSYSMIGLEANFFLIILSCIILGISVDDTIHLIYEYQSMIKKDLTILLSRTLKPLFLTTVILNGLFLFFLLSHFQSFHRVSLSLVFAFTVALLFDLILLPAILFYSSKSKVSGMSSQRV